MQNKIKFKGAIITGVLAVECMRHVFFLSMVDLQMGERYIYIYLNHHHFAQFLITLMTDMPMPISAWPTSLDVFFSSSGFSGLNTFYELSKPTTWHVNTMSTSRPSLRRTFLILLMSSTWCISSSQRSTLMAIRTTASTDSLSTILKVWGAVMEKGLKLHGPNRSNRVGAHAKWTMVTAMTQSMISTTIGIGTSSVG